MALLPSQRLGPYEILSAIGAGGMGEVYRARDTRLDRIVAIKILPDGHAARPELRERFEREARTIAGLNHPHICTLHDIGHQDGTDYLVLEFLEGETLADRLKKGPLPLGQVLQYAIEITDALDKAHRKGITHRDLNPGNIMLTKSGTKLLDFGLAKLRQETTPANISLSKLSTANDAVTAQGTIVGTLQYMAPEQLEGREVELRTDIFAFGVVVYEMATGKKAFEGKSQASVIGAILKDDPPPMSSLQPMTPPALDRVVKTCLEKNPDERWQSASDLCRELKWISDGGLHDAKSLPAQPKLRKSVVWMASFAAVLLVALVTVVLYFRLSPAELRPIRFSVTPPEKQTFQTVTSLPGFLSLSPDGTKLAFVAVDGIGHSMLWLRDLDSQIAQPLSGTDGAFTPFWSPDSRFIAFTSGSSLKKVAVSGGPAQTITASSAYDGGTWNRDGDILFSPGPGGPILRVSSEGGTMTPVTSLDSSRQQVRHNSPYFLPDGRHFLYSALSSNPGNTGIFVGSLDSKETKFILNDLSSALYSPPGYLLFVRAGTLFTQAFDAHRLELKGEAIPIASSVEFSSANGRQAVAVSNNGVLAYRLALTNVQFKLVWVDRKGAEQPLPGPPHAYGGGPRLSPDGQRVAITIDESGTHQWLWDIGRGTLTRLTFARNFNSGTVWTPDGKRITFASQDRLGPPNLFWQLADGSGGAERLSTSDTLQWPSSWSPDGQTLAFEQYDKAGRAELWVLHLNDHKTEPFLQTPYNEIAPQFSPDGRWLAYASDESGRFEIYVQPYPGPGGKWQVSTEGGAEPLWARDGELFYRNGEKLVVVETTTRPTFSASNSKVLFQGSYATDQTPLPPAYDVTGDGQRFLFLKAGEQALTEISVVVNWTEELKQKVPKGKK